MVWYEQLTEPLQEMWTTTITLLGQSIPKIIVALLILVFGWIISTFIGKILKRGLQQIKLDKRAELKGVKKALFGISIEDASASLLKWYMFLLFIREAITKLSMTDLANFVGSIITLIPTWIVGAGMIVVCLIIGHWFREKISDSKIMFAEVVGNAVYGLVIYFGIVLALPKFGFTDITILNDAFRFVVGGLSGGIAIAVGIGFGLALKEPAKKILHKWIKKM